MSEVTGIERTSAILQEPFDVDVIEDKNGMLYVPHEHYRQLVIDATDNVFDWDIKQVIFRETHGEVVRRDKETKEDVYPVVMILIGTLNIPGLGSRDGIGVHPIDRSAGEDAAYKSADSDAFKRACMAFGVGLKQLYIESKAQTRSKGIQWNTPPDGGSSFDGSQTKRSGDMTIRNPDADASQKQINLIKKLINEKTPFTDDQFDLDGLTMGEAKVTIDSLFEGRLPDSWTTPDPPKA